MNTRERSEALAAAAKEFPSMSSETITANDLLQVVASELGHPDILDEFQTITGNQASNTKALAPDTILHILSANTPQAGLQSLTRGLLLGSHNRCKLPSVGVPELQEFVASLPPALQAKVEFATELPPEWLSESDVVIVFGNDTTIAHFRSLITPHQIFLPHGHMVSMGVVFEDPDNSSAPLAARDISLHDQQGCLSPHVIYVAESTDLTAHDYAASLANAMEEFDQTTPRSPITPAESARIVEVRERTRFAAAAADDVALWQSTHGTNWTVIYERDTAFVPSCLNRVIAVKPLPSSLADTLITIRPHLSTVGIWPCNTTTIAAVEKIGASRICPLGQMQFPPPTWHQDGVQTIAPLVRWLDAELSEQ